MKKGILLSFCLLVIFFCCAHPGIGIVRDSKGNIYYTDLKQVWKINRDGTKSIAVPNVHTHELYIDSHDNLFGQHSHYSGEATNQWHYYVWRLSASGYLDTIIQPTEGFFIENFSFVQDKWGNRYWIQHWKEDRLMKTGPDGTTELLATGNFKQVQWMHVANNTLYFIRYDTVFQLSEGKVQAITKGLCNKKEAHNSLFGLWSDTRNNLYVANTCASKVQQIALDGRIRDYYILTGDWSPSGGLFDAEGNLWLLLFNKNNDVRVQKINRSELNDKSIEQAPMHINLLFPVSIGLLTVAVFSILKWKKKR